MQFVSEMRSSVLVAAGALCVPQLRSEAKVLLLQCNKWAGCMYAVMAARLIV